MKYSLMIILAVAGTLAAASATIPTTASTDSAAIAAQSCEGLQALKLPDTTIVLAERVAAGAFRLPEPYLGGPWSPGPRGGQPVVAPADLPAFCRVEGLIRPATDSEIGFELWLPLANWSLKFMGVG